MTDKPYQSQLYYRKLEEAFEPGSLLLPDGKVISIHSPDLPTNLIRNYPFQSWYNLTNTRRFSGSFRGATVARHIVHGVMLILQKKTIFPDLDDDLRAALVYAWMLHDLPESWMGELPKWVKQGYGYDYSMAETRTIKKLSESGSRPDNHERPGLKKLINSLDTFCVMCELLAYTRRDSMGVWKQTDSALKALSELEAFSQVPPETLLNYINHGKGLYVSISPAVPMPMYYRENFPNWKWDAE